MTYCKLIKESKARRKNVGRAWINNKNIYDMVPKSWIVECLKMYKISDKVTKFITEAIKIWKVESKVVENNLLQVKILRGICLGDALSSLLFVIVMMLLCDIFRKCNGIYKFTKLQEKFNHLKYWDNIKLSAKNEKELKTLIQTIRIYKQDIRIGFGVEKCAMLIIRKGKR